MNFRDALNGPSVVCAIIVLLAVVAMAGISVAFSGSVQF